MSTAKLFPIDPENIKHIELLDKFEKENNIFTPIGTYRKEEHTSNEISMELILQESSSVKDVCHIQGYKDIKSCTISFVPKKKSNRKIASMATTYAINTLGMEEVYLKINPEDQNMMDYLESNEFECLGDEKGSIIYLKEKQY